MAVTNRKQRIRFEMIGCALRPGKGSHRFVKAREFETPATVAGVMADQIQVDSGSEASP